MQSINFNWVDYLQTDQGFKEIKDFLISQLPNLKDVNFIIDPEYFSPNPEDVKIEWSQQMHGGSYVIQDFSETGGKTFQTIAYVIPKNGKFEFKLVI